MSSLYEQLKGLKNSEPIRFCMPAHNGLNSVTPYLNAAFDLTELPMTDNLLHAETVLLDLEKRLAYHFCAKRSLIFTCGATSAIHTAIYSVKKNNSKLLVVGEPHASVRNAAKLYGMDLIIVSLGRANDYVSSSALKTTVRDILIADKSVSAILITSPSYLGLLADVKYYAALAHEYNLPIIVDEAHGSHLSYSDLLPHSANDCADLVINSLHKTMPALTGAAILNVHNDSLTDNAVYARGLIHSSSPSYLIMTSIDYADKLFFDSADVYEDVLQRLDAFKINLFGKADEPSPFIDPSRLVIRCNRGYGAKVFDYLISKNIIPETVVSDMLVFIVTPYNACRLDELYACLTDYLSEHSDCSLFARSYEEISLTNATLLPVVENVFNTSDVGVEYIQPQLAVGRIAATEIYRYPPATVLVSVGESISPDVIKAVTEDKNIIGTADGKIKVYII